VVVFGFVNCEGMKIAIFWLIRLIIGSYWAYLKNQCETGTIPCVQKRQVRSIFEIRAIAWRQCGELLRSWDTNRKLFPQTMQLAK